MSTASLINAIERLARLQGASIDPLQLAEAAADLQGLRPSAQVSSLCASLDFAPARWLPQPDQAHLPMLCVLPSGEWGLVIDAEAPTGWRVRIGDQESVHSDEELAGCCAILHLTAAHATAHTDEPASDESGEFSKLLKTALRAHRGYLIDATIASVFIGLLALATSLFSMQVYDRVIPTRGEATLLVLASGVALSVLIELAMKLTRSHLMDHVIVGIDTRLAQQIFQRLLMLRVDQLPPSVGSLAGQMRGYEQVRSFYTASTLFTLVDLPMALLFLGVVAVIATPIVALVLLGFAVIALILGVSIRRKVARLAKEGASWSNMKTGLLVEAVEGIETIKAGSGGWKFLSRWKTVNRLSIQSDLKMRHASENSGYLAGMMQQLSYAALIVVGALVVMQGQMTTGALIACSILSGRILSPILALPGLFVQHAHARAAQEGLEKLYQLKTDHDGVARPLAPANIRGEYALHEVGFAYGNHPAALRVASLAIQPGERIAILGPIGAGKSTLLRLLSGLYVPQAGRVLLDGMDLSQISRHVLSRRIGYLQQDHRLFQGTLRENLLIGLPDPGDDVLLRAMRRTGFDRVVASHPKGLDRAIAEGGKGLSGGQRQLLAFTRLLLSDCSVLLLDEPTATMDEEQERRCLSVLAEEAQTGKTVVVVTHKPSLLPLVGRIIIVANSGIVLDGPRDSVLRQLGATPAVRRTDPPAELVTQGAAA